MPRNTEKFLNLPQGTEGIHLDEALKHRTLTRNLNDLFTSWGYLPVNTPVFDFYDNYHHLLSGKTSDNIYRLMDRDGDLLMLRSDVTLFLARQMGLILRTDDLPVRVSYSDTILRHQHREDISKNEFFQTGVELIGVQGLPGDMEILLLLCRTMVDFELPYYLHLGSRNLFNEIIAPEYRTQELKEALEKRDTEELRRLFRLFNEEQTADFLTRFFLFIGNPEEFRAMLSEAGFLSPSALREARYLLTLSDELKTTGLAENLRLDLSETGSQPYHSGIVFQVYLDGIDSAVASGGRYDNLLENFGFKASSVGFSLLLRKVEALLRNRNKMNHDSAPLIAAGETWKEKYENGEKMRKKGRIVIL